MTFEQLKPGDVFYIDGDPYEALEVGEDVVQAYALRFLCMTARTFDPYTRRPLERQLIHGRIPDLMGDGYLIEKHSAAAFNRDNATPEETEYLNLM